MPVVADHEWRQNDTGTDDVVEVDGAVSVGAEGTPVQGYVVTSELIVGRVGAIVAEVDDLAVKQLHTDDSERVEYYLWVGEKMNELVHVDEIAEINELVKPVEYKKEKKRKWMCYLWRLYKYQMV